MARQRSHSIAFKRQVAQLDCRRSDARIVENGCYTIFHSHMLALDHLLNFIEYLDCTFIVGDK